FISLHSIYINLIYIILFTFKYINKHTFYYESYLLYLLFKFTLLVLLISFVVFLITGSIFGNKLTDPIVRIIEGVELLSQKEYGVRYDEKGIYAKVFGSLNMLAENLNLSERERHKNEKMRVAWIANISHDLKTTLSTIKGYSEIMSDNDYHVSEEEIKHYSKIISEKAVYMEEMIEELRLNEKLRHHALTLNKTKGNLTTFLRNI